MFYLRIIINALLFSSILFFPWWITLFIAVAFLFMFEAYEVLLWGLFGDLLYGAPVAGFLNIEFLFTLLFILLFIGVYFLKKKLILYNA